MTRFAAPPSPPGRKRRGCRAFTLVEIMMATAIGAIVLAAIASLLVMSVRIAYKGQEIDASATNTRLVQEHLNNEMSIAISQTEPVDIRPLYSQASDTTPKRYARIVYRVQVGSFATVQTTTTLDADNLVVVCPADVAPKVHDYLLMDTPDLGTGIEITSVSGSSPGTITLGLASKFSDATTDTTVPKAGALVRIHRIRAYETVEPSPSTSPITELHWYEQWFEDSTDTPTYLVLSKNVDASARYLFAQVPEEPETTDSSIEPAVSWQFSYVSEGNGAVLPGSVASFYQTNYAEGLIMPKSGNPLNTSSILGGGSTTLGTSTTLLSSTTTLGTSTTKISTTTTLGTSTTKQSSTTTTLGTSTTKISSTTTTLGTSLSSTTTKQSSTTLKSTSSTKQSSTTLKSTTTKQSSTTTTKATSLSSTTLQSTTLQSSTTTTKASTTLLSTTTTKASSTTTTKASSTTLQSSTTTTIGFDG